MILTGPQCRAARALIEWPRDQVARLARLEVAVLAGFEAKQADPGEDAKRRLRQALEEGGAVFIDENGGGVGVRLKYARRDVRAINKLESEGGRVAEDDV